MGGRAGARGGERRRRDRSSAPAGGRREPEAAAAAAPAGTPSAHGRPPSAEVPASPLRPAGRASTFVLALGVPSPGEGRGGAAARSPPGIPWDDAEAPGKPRARGGGSADPSARRAAAASQALACAPSLLQASPCGRARGGGRRKRRSAVRVCMEAPGAEPGRRGRGEAS